jgi:predicted porin
MNKKLLTAAIGAALAAAPMFAANAAPTVYGKLNVGVAMIDNGNDKVGDQDSSTIAVTDDASRFGVKGEEDLGGGMKALYMWEIGIDVDNPTGAGIGQTARDTFVGLGGGWGSLRLGQYNTAYKLVSVPTEIFGDTIGDFTANNYSGETRQANNIGYTSPKFGGIQFALEYATQTENGNDTTERNPLNGSISWSSGPLYLAVGYYDYDQVTGPTPVGQADDAIKVSGQFKSGALRLAATYETQSGTDVLVTDTINVAGGFAFGNHELNLSYSIYDRKTEGAGPSDADADCSAIAAGYFYNFSKNTALKVVYNMIDNDANATCSGRMIGSASVQGLPNPTAGKDPSGLQAQISTAF